MGEADFARHREGAATDEGDGRDGVVRAMEGTHSHQCGALDEFARHAVNLGGLKSLAQGERRHDGRQTLGYHRLARARATHQHDVVSTGTGDLKGALDVLLSFIKVNNFNKSDVEKCRVYDFLCFMMPINS